MVPCAAPAVAAVVGFQSVHQRELGGGLQPRVQRGAHVVAALVEALAQGRVAAAADLLDEIVGVLVLRAAWLGLDLQILRLGGLGFGAGDPAQGGHLVQDHVAPLHRRGLLADRMVVLGALRQRGQVGAFRQVEVGDRLAEVVVGGRAHAVGPVTQPYLVQIELEDLLLGKRLLQPAGENRFLELASESGLARQQDVLGHLLGDGGAALEAATLQGVEDVLQHGPGQAAHVDAAVLEEIVILRRQEGLGQRRGDPVVGHEDAALVGELADQGAVGGVGAGGGRRPVVGQVARVRHVVEQPGRIDRERQRGDGHGAEHAHTDDCEPLHGGIQREQTSAGVTSPQAGL